MLPAEVAAKQVASSKDGVLLDTNVLLLLLIGSIEESLIEKCTRLRAYKAEDFRVLRSILARARSFAVTPHIAAETWNLGENALHSQSQSEFKAIFIKYVSGAREIWVNLNVLAMESYFPRLGPADSGIARVKRRRPLVVTDDALLYRQLELGRQPAINFTHLRQL